MRRTACGSRRYVRISTSRPRHNPCTNRPAQGDRVCEDGGRRIVIITPRIIGFREEVNQPRTTDYPFSLFEMRFDAAGKGQGKMAYATKITFDKKKSNVELENYSSEPVRLNNLELQVKK
jgi:hypothetical protein